MVKAIHVANGKHYYNANFDGFNFDGTNNFVYLQNVKKQEVVFGDNRKIIANCVDVLAVYLPISQTYTTIVDKEPDWVKPVEG